MSDGKFDINAPGVYARATENPHAHRGNPEYTPDCPGEGERWGDLNIQIVLQTNGFVDCGLVLDDGRESGEMILLHAVTLTRWGTVDLGLGSLCWTGPTTETKTHLAIPYGAGLVINRAQVVRMMQCDPHVWVKRLGITSTKMSR